MAALAFAEPENDYQSGPNPDPAADAWYGFYGYPGYYGHRYYGYGGYYGHRYGYGYWGRKKREANPQVLLAHPYAYAHYVPTTYVAPTVFNHENHPSTVITATGHHVYAGTYYLQFRVIHHFFKKAQNETAVLNVFQDLKSEISEKSDQN